MKKIMAVFFAMFLLLPAISMAQGDGGQLRLMGVAGLGQGGMGGEEVYKYDYFYAGSIAEVPLDSLTPGLSWRFSAYYSVVQEDGDTTWDSSILGSAERFQTIRLVTGPTIEGGFEVNGVKGFYANNISGGVDFIIADGIQAAVVQDDFLIGMGAVYNQLNASFRFGEDEYEFGSLTNQSYLRVTNWFALGPQFHYIWFNQDPDGDGEMSLVYEPSFGGQIKLSQNRADPDYSLTIGSTWGSYVGTAWSVDFWYRF